MPRRLTISINFDGAITAEASGTPGPDCLDALDQLRNMLHAEIEDSRPTPEFSGAVTPATIDLPAENQLEDNA